MQNKSTSTDRWTRASSIIFCVIAAVFALYISFRYVFPLVLPIVIGGAVGAAASALAAKLSKYTRASKKVVSFAVLLTLLGSLVAILFFVIRRLTDELGKLAQSISSGNGEIVRFFEEAVEFAQRISDRIASLLPSGSEVGNEELSEKINQLAEKIFGNILSELGSAVPGILSAILRALPEILLGVIVTVIVAFYFTLDGTRIRNGIRNLLPPSVCGFLKRIKKEAAVAASGYMKSYSLILLITFAEIFFGLSVLGVEYSFLIAAVSAAVDILPIFGVGIILIPWAFYCLITRDIFLGIGLIVLYVICVIVRQFTEPKIVGENLGLHPLLTLASFYLGYRLFSFVGILIAPILLILWRAFRSHTDEKKITLT